MAKCNFFLGINGVVNAAYPIYKELKVKYEKESKQEYFRTEIDGKVKFLKDDYERIINAPFDSIYEVKIEAEVFNNTTAKYDLFYIDCKFIRTDCTIDADNKIIETKLTAVDGYEDILAGLEKEYSLIELAPAIESLTLYKRPIIQLYTPGEKVVGCFMEGVYWEQECDPITDLTELNTKFGFSATPYKDLFRYMEVLGGDFTIDDNKFLISMDQDSVTVNSKYGLFHYRRSTSLLTFSDNDNGHTYTAEPTFSGSVRQIYKFNFPDSHIGTAEVSIWDYYRIFVNRVLHDNYLEESIKVDITDLTEFGNNRNYRYATPLDFDSFGLVITHNVETSSKPTKYGQRQPGEYYKKVQMPSYMGLSNFYPICKSVWGDASFWFNSELMQSIIDTRFRKEITLKHAYTLQSCIANILSKVAPVIKFLPTGDYSMFFFGDGMPIINKIFLAPITNILKGEYDNPAQKMPITLKKIFDMLSRCFKCYWFIDGDKLRIEHISFFTNGGKYYTQNIGIDTTVMTDPRTGKVWSFGKNTYEFALDNMPERFQFAWQDDCSEPFTGYPLEIRNNYVKKGQIEEVSISGFSSDIDMMLLQPDTFGKDSIALIATDSDNKVPYETITVGENTYVDGEYVAEKETFRLQNGSLSMASLVKKYYLSDLPGSKITLNKKQINSQSDLDTIPAFGYKVKRSKKQKLKVPKGLFIDYKKLIKTKLGVGEISEMVVDLSSEVAEISILHNTEN